MKTILVIYTDTKIEKVTASHKKYCFRTNSDVELGDLLKSSNYTTAMQVVKVIDKDYIYYHPDTGEMSNELTSTKQWEIKELKVVEADGDVVTAVKL